MFANNDWAAIIEACHANEVPDTWVSDGSCYKDMDIGGRTYRIDIIGKNHDDMSDGTGKAPLTFQMHDCYDTTYQMNSSNTNAGGWRDCQMRTQTMPALKALLPAEVQAGIRAVNKLTSAGNQSPIIVTTSDDLFLPSEVDVFGYTQYSFAGEGTQYDYYMIGNRTAKNINGNLNAWWTRSPNATRSDIICLIGINGGIGGTNPINSYGVPFCFCF